MPTWIYGLFLLLGGIGLFLYGINYTSKSLEDAAGDNLRKILEKVTGRGIFGFLAGLFVTMLIQSSGATCVIVIGFVGAGLMSLKDSLYIMLGANIGTTVTAQIIAFKIDNFAPLILFVGVVMVLFIKRKLVKKFGSVILGFGLLFVGIYIMGEAVDMLPLQNIVEKFLTTFDNPVLCLLFGLIITAVIQSSSASIGILQVLTASTVASFGVGLSDLTFIIIGMNVGAAAPMAIVGLSGNRHAKRAALACIVAKLIEAVVFVASLLVFPSILDFIIGISPEGDVSRQIANFHLLYNIVANIAVLPLVPVISKYIMKWLPDSETMEFNARKLLYLDSETLLNPVFAVRQVKKEVIRMAEITKGNLRTAIDSFFEKNTVKAEEVLETEKTINYLNHEITGFLVQLHGQKLYDKDIEEAGIMLRVVADIERVGDHAENIAEYTLEIENTGARISDVALTELKDMAEKSMEVLVNAIDTYANNRPELLDEVSRLEEEVDVMQDTNIEHHIKRLKKDMCDPAGGVVFTDMTSDLERCSDHAINIAFAINGEKTTIQFKKAYVVTRDMNE